MSTFYYMGCDKCKKRTPIIMVSRLAGDHLDNAESHLEFLKDHRYCDEQGKATLTFFSEHDDDRMEYSKQEVPKKTTPVETKQDCYSFSETLGCRAEALGGKCGCKMLRDR